MTEPILRVNPEGIYVGDKEMLYSITRDGTLILLQLQYNTYVSSRGGQSSRKICLSRSIVTYSKMPFK